MMSLSVSSPQCEFFDELKKAIVEDEHLQLIVQQCLNNIVNNDNYAVKDGLLFWQHRLVVPVQSSLIYKILTEYHDAPIGGHAGVTRTLARVASQFYWPNMRQHVQKFIAACLICQQAKSVNKPYVGLLQPLLILEQVWEDITMDFITGLPLSSGFNVIMVVVDRLSKYAHFIPLKSDYSCKTVAETFMHNLVKLHGMPKSIVSHKDKVFTSKFWKHLFQLQGTTLAMSSVYHPQTNGQSEAANKCLEMYLRCFSFKNPKAWSKALSWAELWYNTALHSSLGMSSFKALYGRDPPMLIRYTVNTADLVELQQQLLERDKILLELKENLRRAQQVTNNGWAEGECKGRAGWFPFSYTERRERVLASKVSEVF